MLDKSAVIVAAFAFDYVTGILDSFDVFGKQAIVVVVVAYIVTAADVVDNDYDEDNRDDDDDVVDKYSA